MTTLAIPIENISAVVRLLNLATVRGPDDCWLFKGSLDRNGYGHFKLNGRVEMAHRASYKLLIGDPGDLHVMHKCDVRGCINPKHFELGTHADNMADCARKGRATTSRVGNGYRKLTSEDIQKAIQLHSTGVPKTQIARQLGVTPTNIRYHIKKELARVG